MSLKTQQNSDHEQNRQNIIKILGVTRIKLAVFRRREPEWTNIASGMVECVRKTHERATGRTSYPINSESHFSQGIAILMKPLDCFLKPILERMFGLKPKELFCTIHIQVSSRLAVRL